MQGCLRIPHVSNQTKMKNNFGKGKNSNIYRVSLLLTRQSFALASLLKNWHIYISVISSFLSTLALFKVIRHGTGASHLLEINYRVVTKHHRLSHDIEMVLVSILVCAAHIRTPLGIPIIWAEVRHHDCDGLASSTAGTTGRAW